VFRQEVSNGRVRCSQLQEALHQRSTDLEAAQAQLATAREERAAAEAQQQHAQRQLQAAQAGNSLLRQQMSQVGCCANTQAQCGLVLFVRGEPEPS
jgi:septal ring factor EnvC (AmiA/AmiB activator)